MLDPAVVRSRRYWYREESGAASGVEGTRELLDRIAVVMACGVVVAFPVLYFDCDVLANSGDRCLGQ